MNKVIDIKKLQFTKKELDKANSFIDELLFDKGENPILIKFIISIYEDTMQAEGTPYLDFETFYSFAIEEFKSKPEEEKKELRTALFNMLFEQVNSFNGLQTLKYMEGNEIELIYYQFKRLDDRLRELGIRDPIEVLDDELLQQRYEFLKSKEEER